MKDILADKTAFADAPTRLIKKVSKFVELVGACGGKFFESLVCEVCERWNDPNDPTIATVESAVESVELQFCNLTM